MTSPPIQLEFTPLSPVHVGSGQTLEPFDYTLLDQGGSKWLQVINSAAIFRGLGERDRAELDGLLTRNSFSKIREWLQGHATGRAIRFRIQAQESTYEDLIDNLNNPDRLGEIHLSTRDAATGLPFIPGSSVKGAIRTALIAARMPKDDRDLLSVNRAAEFEAHVLGNLGRSGRPDLYADPLRQLQIGDIPLRDDSCYIDRVQIVRKPTGRDDARRQGTDTGIFMHRDVTWSLIEGERLTYQGRGRLLGHLNDPRRMENKPLPMAFGLRQICESCNAFYRPRLERELQTYTVDQSVRRDLLAAAAGVAEHECLIRLGRHSHFECVTVGPPYARTPRRGVGATRTYIDGQLPLGWALLRFVVPSRTSGAEDLA